MSGTTLFLGLILGSIGTGYFMYGKKQRRLVPMISGTGLFFLPYLVQNVVALSGISLVLCLLPFFIQPD